MALLGWPVAHSLSPVMHNAAFREAELDHVYLALATPPDRLRAAVGALEAWGAVGANVTVPHKLAVIEHCDQLTEEARLVGAVNTLLWTPDGLVGDNTDAVGLGTVLAAELAVGPDAGVLVLGTGGAARAVAVAVARIGAALVVVGRRPDACAELAALAAGAGAREVDDIELDEHEEVARQVRGADVVINATPLGLEGETLPDAFMQLSEGQIALDLIYNPPQTPFLVAARERGAEAHHGLGMLVAQAAASFRAWTGHDAPDGAMSAAAMGALARG